jgi:hypothetical protein
MKVACPMIATVSAICFTRFVQRRLRRRSNGNRQK